MEYQVLLYYKYVFIENPEEEMCWQREICESLGLKGRIIVAREGINGTVEGTKENTESYIQAMETGKYFSDACPVEDREGPQRAPIFNGIHWKRSVGNGQAFPKLSVKARSEIVSLNLSQAGVCDINPNEITGKRLSLEELHNWIKEKKEFYIVDMRNIYEHKVGHFEGSVLMPLENFRDLPRVVQQIAHLKNKTVLTVCTGGVRCEKASGFLISQGFRDVYQLNGGIVSYMEKYPNENFKGKLYVFDGRITQSFYTDDEKHEIVGKCDQCGNKSENFVNCANPICHRHFIACENCLAANSGTVFCPQGCVISRHGRPVLQ